MTHKGWYMKGEHSTLGLLHHIISSTPFHDELHSHPTLLAIFAAPEKIERLDNDQVAGMIARLLCDAALSIVGLCTNSVTASTFLYIPSSLTRNLAEN